MWNELPGDIRSLIVKYQDYEIKFNYLSSPDMQKDETIALIYTDNNKINSHFILNQSISPYTPTQNDSIDVVLTKQIPGLSQSISQELSIGDKLIQEFQSIQPLELLDLERDFWITQDGFTIRKLKFQKCDIFTNRERTICAEHLELPNRGWLQNLLQSENEEMYMTLRINDTDTEYFINLTPSNWKQTWEITQYNRTMRGFFKENEELNRETEYDFTVHQVIVDFKNMPGLVKSSF